MAGEIRHRGSAVSKKTFIEYGSVVLMLGWMLWTTIQIYEHRQILKEMT